MPDILVRNIDDATAERIKTIARERDWSINEVIVYILKHSLGFGGDDIMRRGDVHHDVAVLAGTWDPGEAAAFRTALEAFEKVDGKPLFDEQPNPPLPKPGQPPK